LRPVRNVVVELRRFWAQRLGQGNLGAIDQETRALFSVPFVDYARGDGRRIGPGEAQGWSAVLLTHTSAWAEQYRGLWGLDTGDPFGGERAPAGPKYNRDGSIRAGWYDPLGWAGLDKVSPPSRSQHDLACEVGRLEQQRAALAEQIDLERSSVRGLALQQQALDAADASAGEDGLLEAAERELHGLLARASMLDERLLALRSHQQRLGQGESVDPQAHIRHRHRPEPALGARARLIDIWGALSGALLILALCAIWVVAPAGWPLWAVAVVSVAFLIEAMVQRRLVGALLNVAIALAMVTAVILIKDFWQTLLIVVLIGLLVLLIVQNLAELRRTRRRGAERGS
ncbi:MAG: hypothetical protein JOZ81_18385, partial [Chloroflexi bacterium]|nr:hypothetical protein [Chloroflexota bacterium]